MVYDTLIRLCCTLEMCIIPGVAMRNRLYDHCIGKQALVNIAK
jgi:hypothetical protein